jgi:hypothetical protein
VLLWRHVFEQVGEHLVLVAADGGEVTFPVCAANRAILPVLCRHPTMPSPTKQLPTSPTR